MLKIDDRVRMESSEGPPAEWEEGLQTWWNKGDEGVVCMIDSDGDAWVYFGDDVLPEGTVSWKAYEHIWCIGGGTANAAPHTIIG